MSIKITLNQFSGPLDLLLSLLDGKELSISELALSEVTEQFLVHLDQMEQKNPEELADFLVIATRLLLLKSRQLLPQFGEEEDDGPALEDQLRLYKRFVEASKVLNERWNQSTRSIPRIEPPRHREVFQMPHNATLEALRESMVHLVSRLEPPKPITHTRIDRAVSLKEKVDMIRSLLSRRSHVLFSETLSSDRSKTDMIVGFLAVLELVKAKAVFLTQEQQFGDIVIGQTSSVNG